jgi:hypothetical protein
MAVTRSMKTDTKPLASKSGSVLRMRTCTSTIVERTFSSPHRKFRERRKMLVASPNNRVSELQFEERYVTVEVQCHWLGAAGKWQMFLAQTIRT